MINTKLLAEEFSKAKKKADEIITLQYSLCEDDITGYEILDDCLVVYTRTWCRDDADETYDLYIPLSEINEPLEFFEAKFLEARKLRLIEIEKEKVEREENIKRRKLAEERKQYEELKKKFG